MASSSSSSAAFSSKKYDVFISFRGEDTRSNFTSHLHDALIRNKIETYIDYRLEKGEEVWPSLVKAIQDSMLFLIIFSENYAFSTWCLKELTKILECSKHEGYRAIPVFYNIDPSHVRKQSGSYEIAFAKHEQSNHKQHVHNWRDALAEAANLSGWHSSDYRNDAELVQKIVKCVMVKLDCIYQSQSDSKGFVGIHKKVVDVESLLCNGSQDVRFIGIWGMGGIGKTTVATLLFNKLCFAYEGFCFLANIKEESKKYGIPYLKNKLISILLEEKESHIGMPDGATPYAMRRLSRKKVFIVLDDVDDLEQLENLAGGHHWFGSGSKVIITTRDKQVFGKEVDDIYEIKALNFGEAFHLLSLNAFKNDCLGMEFKKLAETAVYYANGIPLALKVLGSFLYGKSKKEWKSQLEKFKKMSCTKIHHVLRLSFDGLDYEEKNIFLDIACFFKDATVTEIEDLLDACGYSTSIALKNLQDKALLTILGGRASMHDLLQEMGWQIVREESMNDPGKRSRLWDSNDIFEVLKNSMGTETIEGLTLDVCKIRELHLSPQVFSSMHKLKFLQIRRNSTFIPSDNQSSLHLPHDIESMPSELRLLSWQSYPLKSLPATFSAEKLVKIEMLSSRLRKLWDGVQNLTNLKTINLASSKDLIELPDFSQALHLEEINLQTCIKLPNVHPSILSLHKLEKLSLDFCGALTCLKSNAHLKSLCYLSLHECSKLKEFSVTSEKNLNLDLSKTAIRDELSSSSGHLSKIETLTLNGCKRLTNLPYKLGDLSYLKFLGVEGCNKKLASNLRVLFDGLGSLETLSLDCSDLFELPNNISCLSSLRRLSLARTHVVSLPVSIKHLSRLQWLYIDECMKLRSLPELPLSITELYACNCTSLETLQLTSAPAGILEEEDGALSYNIGNCWQLDQRSLKAVVTKALLEINKSVSAIEKGIYRRNRAQVVYPGSKFPEWFMYRTTQSPIILDLSSIPRSKDWSFIFCAVISQSSSSAYIDIAWDFSNGQRVDYSYDHRIYVDSIFPDHVYLWYISQLPSEVQRIIEESGADDQCTTYSPTLSIEFIVTQRDTEIKEFGVCPTYALEYQNIIKQMELALETQQSATGRGVGCSYDNTDETETLPRKRKYHFSLEEIE